MMQKAIILEAPGGPEQLRWVDRSVPEPKEREILIQHDAIGLNFIDIYQRSGLYALPAYPAILGLEGAGKVVAKGSGVTHFEIGDRVAYGTGPLGAYAQYRTLPAERAIRLPDAVSNEIAAAATLKGLTAFFLLRRTFMVNEYHTILVYAAAGGVGLYLCQWARLLGATVIGTVGSEEKAEIAAAYGCDYVIQHQRENIAERVKEITRGRGVNAVYDAVGQATFQSSLDSLMKRGIFISYGQASGPVPPVEAQELQKRGSLFFTRPSLMDYMSDPREYQQGVTELYQHLTSGKLEVRVGQSYYLSDAAHAHRDLEKGATLGATILLPDQAK
jgi:NADPH2:quinone reductase